MLLGATYGREAASRWAGTLGGQPLYPHSALWRATRDEVPIRLRTRVLGGMDVSAEEGRTAQTEQADEAAARIHAEVVRLSTLLVFPAGYTWSGILVPALWIAASRVALDGFGALAFPTAAIGSIRAEMRWAGVASAPALAAWLRSRNGGEHRPPFSVLWCTTAGGSHRQV